MNLFDKPQGLQQRIAELTAGKEIDAKHIKVLLSEERQIEFDAEWRRQQALRKQTKPTALNTYETLHRQAAALLARCGSAAAKTKAEQTALKKLQLKLSVTIEAAHSEVQRVTKKQPTVAQWLDRDFAALLMDADLASNGNSAKELRTITQQLAEQFHLLPVLVTSRSEHRRVTVEERFGWKTKREIRLQLLQAELAALENNLLDDLAQELRRKDVHAAEVYLSGYFSAKEGTSARSAANAALQRHGYPREDALRGRGGGERDREVRDMEAQLLTEFETELDADEREQLALLRAVEGESQPVRKQRQKDGKNKKNKKNAKNSDADVN